MNELPHHSLSLAGLGRFKAFAGHEDFDIRPITLLYGYNSSGKSSFLHSLLFLDQFRRDGNANVFKTHLGEESVDLGGFEHFIHRKDGLRELPCTFSVGFEETETEASGEYAASDSGLASLVVDPILKLTVGRAPDLIPYLETLEFVSSGDWVVRLSFEPPQEGEDNLPHKTQVNSSHVVWEHLNEAEDEHPLDSDGEVDPSIEERGDEDWNYDDHDDLDEDPLRLDSLTDDEEDEVNNNEYEYLEDSVSTHLRVSRRLEISFSDEDAGSFKRPCIEFFEALMRRTSGAFEEVFGTGRINYLGPLRAIPERNSLAWVDSGPNWSSSGASHWQSIKDDPEVRKEANHWLEKLFGPQYRFVVKPYLSLSRASKIVETVLTEGEGDRALKNLREVLANANECSPEELSDELSNQVGKMLVQLVGGVDQKFDSVRENWTGKEFPFGDSESKLVLEDIQGEVPIEVGARDIGVGVSQVVPLIAMAVSLRNSVILVEQPEIHLHPMQQATLAELIIHSALGDRSNRFALETHSEFFLKKVQRKIGMHSVGKTEDKQPISSDDASVYHVTKLDHSSDPTAGDRKKGTRMKLDSDGALTGKWPDGFFGELKKDVLWYAK